MESPELIETLALASGLAWASGIRLYAVLFFAGALGRFGYVDLPADLHWLGQPLTWSRQSIYSVSFLALRTGCALSAWLTQRLGAHARQSPAKPSRPPPATEH